MSPNKCSGLRSPLQEENSVAHHEVKCQGKPLAGIYRKREEKRNAGNVIRSSVKSEEQKSKDARRGPLAPFPSQKSEAAETPKTPTSSCDPTNAAIAKQALKKPLKGKQAPRKKAQGKTQHNSKLTDFYPVRRSSRKRRLSCSRPPVFRSGRFECNQLTTRLLLWQPPVALMQSLPDQATHRASPLPPGNPPEFRSDYSESKQLTTQLLLRQPPGAPVVALRPSAVLSRLLYDDPSCPCLPLQRGEGRLAEQLHFTNSLRSGATAPSGTPPQRERLTR
ncbi:N-lysine methyltransferase SETD8 [Sciurus carolinensis]|uniref:N-lysine methyltransferase SETD8 n=1 Tax=Sciurus carolinensis TaxID=30640 RepID=A0AA41NEG6_SCICA|nr:N-lysine methyltransferase SETD8 [Sciurus carolinensis]